MSARPASSAIRLDDVLPFDDETFAEEDIAALLAAEQQNTARGVLRTSEWSEAG